VITSIFNTFLKFSAFAPTVDASREDRIIVWLERLKTSMNSQWRGAAYRLRSYSLLNPLLAGATDHQSEIIEDLETEGVHVTSVERLLTPAAHATLLAAAKIITNPDTQNDPSLWSLGTSSNDITAEAMLARFPAIYLMGLDAALLRLVELYIREPVGYHGAVIRRSLVDERRGGTRLWHQDGEDIRVLRMVVYLNDVVAGGGPFEYIPRSTGLTYRRFAGQPGPLTNERMQQVIPYAQWKRIEGLAGTVVLCDTAKVFHHESMQTERERSVVMIGYSSQRPMGMTLAMNHFPVERVMPALTAMVPAHNRPHVFDWRRKTV